MPRTGRISRRRATAAIAALAAAPLLPARAAPKTLSVALMGDFPRLDPSKDTSPLGFNFKLNVFDALTEIARNGEVHPRLAESWSYSKDLMEWTFALRRGVTFHDGSPFTAADVVWTVRRILDDPTSPVRTFLRLVKDVQDAGGGGVRFTLTQPYGIFDRQMTYVSIMSKTYFDRVGDAGYASHPVGTGPYGFVRWVKDDRTVLQANPRYWRGAPAVQTATYRPIPAEASRAAALLSGEVDLVPALAPSLLRQLSGAPGVKTGIAPGFRVVFLSLNPNVPPLDKPEIREAVDRAVDRESLTKNLLRGLGKPTGIMVPPMDIGYDPAFTPTPYDPDAARRLVRQAGYDGRPIPLQYPNNNLTMANEVAQAIAGYLGAVGLKVELRPMEFTAFFPLWLQNKLGAMYLFAFGSTGYHADGLLTSLYEEGSHATRVNKEIDRLLKQERTVTDPTEQRKLVSEAFRLSNQDRFLVPLYDEMQAYAEREGVGYDPWPDGFVRLYDLT